MRLFLALDLSPGQRAQVAEDVLAPLERLLPGLRRTAPESLHLTLRFLGEVGEERVADIAAALSRAVARSEPFALSFGRPGVFPGLRRARVLWLAVADGADRVKDLAAELGAELAALGFPPPEQPFVPHLTLGRMRRPPSPALLRETLGGLRGFRPEPALVRRAVLYQSRLRPQGPEYVPQLQAEFGGPGKTGFSGGS